MKCSGAKILLNMAADNELNGQIRESLFEHLNVCRICNEEYSRILSIKKKVLNSISMQDLSKMDLRLAKSKFKDWRSLYMKRKAIAASIAVLLLVSTIIPVNGQSIAGSISEWVSSLSINTGKTEYTVTTDLEQKSIGDEVEEVPDFEKAYSSVTDLPEDFEYSIPEPKYIPQGYSRSQVVHYNFDEGMTNILTLRYNNTQSSSDAPGLYIDYEFIKKDISKREIRLGGATKVKDIKVSSLPGFISLNQPSGSSDFVKLSVMVDKGDFKMLRITMLVDKAKTKDGVSRNIEEELIKIAESILGENA